MERSFRGKRKRSGMDFAEMRAPAETQRSGLRGKEEGQGNGAQFSREAETERYGLCPDERRAQIWRRKIKKLFKCCISNWCA